MIVHRSQNERTKELRNEQQVLMRESVSSSLLVFRSCGSIPFTFQLVISKILCERKTEPRVTIHIVLLHQQVLFRDIGDGNVPGRVENIANIKSERGSFFGELFLHACVHPAPRFEIVQTPPSS